MRPATALTGTASPLGLFVNVTSLASPGQDLDVPDGGVTGSEGYSTNPPLDVVTVIAVNTNAADRTLNIQWGVAGVTGQVRKTITAGSGPMMVLDREVIAHGQAIRVWASASGDINVKMAKWPYTG
jgi:hypothetical protein